MRKLAALVILIGGVLSAAFAQVNVLTARYDNYRTGVNSRELVLKPSLVNPYNFGKLFSRKVDGQMYASPLIVNGVDIPGKGKRNLVICATMHNSVYAFDAEDPTITTPYWRARIGVSVPVPNNFFGNRYGPYHDIAKEIGIVSTPVIDATSNTVYGVAFTQSGTGGPYHQYLFALDLATGSYKYNSPVAIKATVNGTGDGSAGGKITFDPMQHMQRPALLLANRQLYFSFASHADTDPYHGWVFAYDLTNLTKKRVYCTTPNGGEGGIWGAGGGACTDDKGNVYVAVGNGSFDGLTNFADSTLKFGPSATSLTMLDYFTPHNQQQIADWDADYGSSGSLYIPGYDVVLSTSKLGIFYITKPTNMGGYNPVEDSQIYQEVQATNGHIHGAPAYFQGADGDYVYVWSEYDNLRRFKFVGGKLDPNPLVGPVRVPDGMPGAMITISSRIKNNGIVWANHPYSGDANPETRPGILRAFDAQTLQELWNSEQNPAKDSFGNFAKFSYPVVANGRVYLSTFSDQLVVYGITNPNERPIVKLTAPSPYQIFAPGASIGVSASASDSDGVAKVEFYDTGRLIATDSVAPYSYRIQKASNGLHEIYAVAYDTKGAQTKSQSVTIAVGPLASGDKYSFDFQGNSAATLAPADVAGIVPLANWNTFTGNYGNAPLTVASNGGWSSVKVSWASENVWNIGIPVTDANSAMMNGYLDDYAGGTTTVTVSGLADKPALGYDVIVYADGDNGGAQRKATYTLLGVSKDNTDNGVNFNGSFVESPVGNYVIFRNVKATSFTMYATPSGTSDGAYRAPVNAIQIIPSTS